MLEEIIYQTNATWSVNTANDCETDADCDEHVVACGEVNGNTYNIP
jgi:hypothetical protein